MPEVSVVIPARDAAATLPRTLAALAEQTLARDRFEVIVADDGSAGAAGGADRVVPVEGAPRGPGAARNAGAATAKGAVLAFTDADCVPEPAWLERGLQAMAHADLVQGAVRPERPPGPYDRTVWVSRAGGLFETANLFIRRDIFTALGGFPPGLTPGGGKELGEDVLLGWAAKRSGARTAFANDAVVAHAVFERSAHEYIADRARLTAFPALVDAVPELRSALFWRRLFLTKRSAAFDAAILGLATRRRAAALPYAAMVLRDARTKGKRAAAAEVAADAVGAAALAAGSLRHGSPLL